MRNDILFETERFNFSQVKEQFINPCCFGQDLVVWLRRKLLERGLEVIAPDQEDWGWYIEVEHRGSWYFVGIGGNADESSEKPNQGEWRIMVEKRRSLWQKLSGNNKMSDSDDMVNIIHENIDNEPDLKNVRLE